FPYTTLFRSGYGCQSKFQRLFIGAFVVVDQGEVESGDGGFFCEPMLAKDHEGAVVVQEGAVRGAGLVVHHTDIIAVLRYQSIISERPAEMKGMVKMVQCVVVITLSVTKQTECVVVLCLMRALAGLPGLVQQHEQAVVR